MLFDAVPPTRRPGPAVARALLVRVLAVAQRLVGAFERDDEVLGQQLVGLQPLHDRRVVRGGAGKGGERERAARVGADACRRSRAARSSSGRILVGTRDDRDPRVVLRGGARHRRATDVDGLDVGTLLERVEVRHDEFERAGCRAGRDRGGGPRCRDRRVGRRGSWGGASCTRPSSISGEPVTSSTRVTGIPAASSAVDVLPDDTTSTPSSCRPFARSTRPSLS